MCREGHISAGRILGLQFLWEKPRRPTVPITQKVAFLCFVVFYGFRYFGAAARLVLL